MKSRKIKAVLSLCISLLLLLNCKSAFATATQNDSSDNAITHLNVSEIKSLSDGGYDYIYNIDGHDNIYHVPPHGFNPLTATDAQLDEYGFPARPSDPDQLKHWENIMSHCKSTLIPDVVSMKVNSSPLASTGNVTSNKTFESLNTAINSNTSLFEQNSSNWSGYINYQSSNCYLSEVQAVFEQPTIDGTSEQSSIEYSWVGLGGDNLFGRENNMSNLDSVCLLQIGTAMSGTKVNNQYVYHAWYEYFDNSGNGIDAVTIKYGSDNMAIYATNTIYVNQ
jgi:hypothetical protein